MGGALIREARLRAGLSQRQLAERLGTTQSALARWENGRSEPAYATVMRAIRAAGFTVDLHLEPDDGSDYAQAQALLRLPIEERAAEIAAFADLADDLQKAGRAALPT